MTNERQIKLIQIYMYVCKVYLERLQYHCMRMSNNRTMQFTDEEVLTVYLFCTAVEQRFTIKSIHTFAKEYLSDWFPRLPTYQTFNARLNRMNSALRELSEDLFSSFQPVERKIKYSKSA